MDDHDSVDISRLKNDEKFTSAWMRLQRLDYIIVTSATTEMVPITSINPSCTFDHAIPWITIEIDESGEHGKGY